jgi:hypothetical protein
MGLCKKKQMAKVQKQKDRNPNFEASDENSDCVSRDSEV